MKKSPTKFINNKLDLYIFSPLILATKFIIHYLMLLLFFQPFDCIFSFSPLSLPIILAHIQMLY